MPSITFERAWREYRCAEPRLPPKPPPVVPERVAGVREILDRFDLVILDAWGVLNLGDTPIPSAREAVAAMRASGLLLAVLSNDASTEKHFAMATHRRRGFPFTPDEIVAGLDLLPQTLERLHLPEPIGLIVDPPAPLPALTGPMLRLGTERADYDRVSGFVFLSSESWDEMRQELLQESLARSPRPLVVCNPDIASPGGDLLGAEPGYFAHRIAAATGLVPEFCGKPFPAIYRKVGDHLPRVLPERILCVGDTLHTDILGARAAGFKAMLVEDGFCLGRDALALAAECGIWPDFIGPGI